MKIMRESEAAKYIHDNYSAYKYETLYLFKDAGILCDYCGDHMRLMTGVIIEKDGKTVEEIEVIPEYFICPTCGGHGHV